MLQRLASLIAFSVILINCFSTSPALSQKSAPIRFNPPPPPPDRGLPGNRGEGASRGDCTALDLPLTALVPSYEQRLNQGAGETTITQVWGLTSVEQPSFWFYVPYNQSSIQAIEFVLQTDQNKTIHRADISVPPVPGIVRVQLQKTTAFLETNKPYHWFFKVRVVCNPNQSATLDYVEGWVQRVNLDAALRDEFKQLLPQEQASIYAKNGIWYDALTTLAELLLTGSQDLGVAEDWKNLLKVIKLEKMSTKLLI
ncbi:DUF928 domain-containing protein (plasmid) [Anabaena sp. FACHB-709]|uniref:DUF928 domain-containing protein n=2 Tax=Nostocaceae TaxID=1162 RepID=A0A1Z4KVC3_ANAVA|nr:MULTISPECIES: DUF928 domain-containing protein [Nostocaceae]BAY72884.1 hypothetical protein NIES23_57120 [Trichormus variabilis NIES-23]MBD2175110.1 DUF928 domain-containing protein [Anabaena cylindrica FACHB-318]MBD2267023.1 DUF928 domain-containing protein [Anabaena sp. FACHB-709]MBD2276573.1 DUF928 domain-containing protein [Nostoc sp. PCC 7120 = FACHB-418]MBD2287095.1 DUF928 domain-containing protein [Anabaena cylindrica FACHB-170]